MLRSVLNLNRSGKGGSPGSAPLLPIPNGIEIAQQSLADVPASPYDVFFFTCNDVGPMLISPENYLSDQIRSTVYAIFCSQDSADVKIKRVHFIARVFGLSKSFQSASDGDFLTVWGFAFTAPGQGNPIGLSTSQRAEHWNVRVPPADLRSLDCIFVPAYDRWDDLRNPSNSSPSQWAYDAGSSKVTYSITQGSHAGVYTYDALTQTYNGVGFGSAGQYRVTDDLIGVSIEFSSEGNVKCTYLAPIWTLVALESNSGQSDFVWLCLTTAPNSSYMAMQFFDATQRAIFTVTSASMTLVCLGPYKFTAAGS